MSSAWAQDHARGLLSGDKVNRRLYDLLSESLGFEATLGNLSHAYSNIKRQEEDVRPALPAHRCCCFTAFELEATAAQNRSGDARVWPGSVARHEAVLLVPLPRACRNEHTLRPLSAPRALLPAQRTGADAAAATRTRCSHPAPVHTPQPLHTVPAPTHRGRAARSSRATARRTRTLRSKSRSCRSAWRSRRTRSAASTSLRRSRRAPFSCYCAVWAP